MTISSQVRKAGPFAGNDATTVFPFTFKVFQASDIYVILGDDATGAESVLALDTHYSVALNANQDASPGGNVTLPAALAAGLTLTVTSSLPYLQPTDLTNQGGFYPKVITTALDKLTIFVQQLAEVAGRSLKFPLSDGPIEAQMPGRAARANRLLSFDENGGPTVTSFEIEYLDQLNADTRAAADEAEAAKLVAVDAASRADASADFAEEKSRLVGQQVAAVTPTAVRISGDGVTTEFTMPMIPGSENNTQVYISGVYQQKDTYSVVENRLVFSEAPPAGSDNIEVMVAPSVMVERVNAQDVAYIGPDGLVYSAQDLANATDPAKGAGMVGYHDSLAPAYLKTVSDILNSVSVSAFRFIPRAKWAGIQARTYDEADLDSDIQAALDSGAKEIYFPAGRYPVLYIAAGESGHVRGAGKYATTFWLPPGVVKKISEGGRLTGIGSKSGIQRVQFSDFEYDGNSANNRGWGPISTDPWNLEYEDIYAMGLYFGTYAGAIPASHVSINNIYSHDVVRDNVVWADDVLVDGSGWHLSNSDADHLIYANSIKPATVDGILLEGFWRSGALVYKSGRFSNVVVRNMAANPVTPYMPKQIIQSRIGTGPTGSVDGLIIDGFDPSVMGGEDRFIIQFDGLGGSVCNVVINQTVVDESRNVALVAVDADNGGNGDYSVNGVKWRGAQGNTSLVRSLPMSGIVDGVLIHGVGMKYAPAVTRPSSAGLVWNSSGVAGTLKNVTLAKARVVGDGCQFVASMGNNPSSGLLLDDVRLDSVGGNALQGLSLSTGMLVRGLVVDAGGVVAGGSVYGSRVAVESAMINGKRYSGGGTQTGTGDAITTAFSIPHGLAEAPTVFSVNAGNANSRGAFHVTADATNLVVTYSAAPAAGGVRWYWAARVAP